LGLPPNEININGDGEALYLLEQSVLESGQGVRRELRILQGDVMTSHDITIEPLKGARGEVSGLTVAVMETTDLRRMEAEAVRNLMRIEVQRRLIAERELERTRIARELHDGPLQELIATNFNLVDAMNITEKDARLAKMRMLQDLLQKQIRELRQFCNELRPPVLAPFGLEKTIHAHVEGLRELYPNLKIHLNLEKDGQRLPEELRMTLFRIYQELMNNVIRHSSATDVTIRFNIQGQRATLGFEDNGIGFSSPQNWVDFARKGHLGLVGVQERVQIMGGTVEIISKPGDGTEVRVDIPFQTVDPVENKPIRSSG
jgi:signal transduction histidine kinase